MTILKYFLKCGFIKNKKNQPCTEIIVAKFTDICLIIIPLFQKYPLQGAKIRDFQDFVKVAELMKNKAHLTREGLNQIRNIKDGMNKKRKS
jgi:hypothetical protein